MIDYYQKYVKYKHKYISIQNNQIGGTPNEEIITQIYHDKAKSTVFSVYITGGGTSAISQLFAIPGASRCIMEAIVPYNQGSTDLLLQKGYENEVVPIIDSYSSVKTGKLLAGSALKKSIELFLRTRKTFSSLEESNVFGIASTSVIRSSESDDISYTNSYKCVACLISDNKRIDINMKLARAVDRHIHERDCAKLIINLLKCGYNNRPIDYGPIDYVPIIMDEIENTNPIDPKYRDIVATFKSPETNKNIVTIIANQPITNEEKFINLISNNLKMLLVLKTGKIYTDIKLPLNTLIVPGSFNPFHAGHFKMTTATINKFYLNKTRADINLKITELGAKTVKATTIFDQSAKTPADQALFQSNTQRYQEQITKLKQELISPLQPLTVFEITCNNADKDIFANNPVLLARADEIKTQNPDDYMTKEEYILLIYEEINNRIEVLKRNIELFNVAEQDPNNKISNYAIVITKENTVKNKSDIFPGCKFIIGYDLFIRLFNPKYYMDKTIARTQGEKLIKFNQSVYNMNASFYKIASKGCEIIVAGRRNPTNGQFEILDKDNLLALILESYNITPNFDQTILNMFFALTEAEFSLDMSSTILREQGRSI